MLTAVVVHRYLYGKRLQGTAFVLFGVMVDDEKKSIPQSLRRVQVPLASSLFWSSGGLCPLLSSAVPCPHPGPRGCPLSHRLRLQVNDGDGEAVLSMATLRERFANPQELLGHSLYVSVTVLTESGVEGDHRGHRGLGETAVTRGAGTS